MQTAFDIAEVQANIDFTVRKPDPVAEREHCFLSEGVDHLHRKAVEVRVVRDNRDTVFNGDGC